MKESGSNTSRGLQYHTVIPPTSCHLLVANCWADFACNWPVLLKQPRSFPRETAKPSSNALAAGYTKHTGKQGGVPRVPSWFITQSISPTYWNLYSNLAMSYLGGLTLWASCTLLAGCEAQWHVVLSAAGSLRPTH